MFLKIILFILELNYYKHDLIQSLQTFKTSLPYQYSTEEGKNEDIVDKNPFYVHDQPFKTSGPFHLSCSFEKRVSTLDNLENFLENDSFVKKLNTSFVFKPPHKIDILQPQNLYSTDYSRIFNNDKTQEISFLAQLAEHKYEEAIKNKAIAIRQLKKDEEKKQLAKSLNLALDNTLKEENIDELKEIAKNKNEVPKKYKFFENYRVPVDTFGYQNNISSFQKNLAAQQTLNKDLPSYFDHDKVPTRSFMQTNKRYHILTHVRPLSMIAKINANNDITIDPWTNNLKNSHVTNSQKSNKFECFDMFVNSNSNIKKGSHYHTFQGSFLKKVQNINSQVNFICKSTKPIKPKPQFEEHNVWVNDKLYRKVQPLETDKFEGICHKDNKSSNYNDPCLEPACPVITSNAPKLKRLVKRYNVKSIIGNKYIKTDSNIKLEKMKRLATKIRADDGQEIYKKKKLQKLKDFKGVQVTECISPKPAPLPRLIPRRTNYPFDSCTLKPPECVYNADEMCNYKIKPKKLKPLLPSIKSNDRSTNRPFGESRRLTLAALDIETRNFLDLSIKPFQPRRNFQTSTSLGKEMSHGKKKKPKVICPKFEDCKCPPRKRQDCKLVKKVVDCTKQNSPYKSFTELNCVDNAPNITECRQLEYLQPRLPILGTISIQKPPPPKHANIDPKVEEDCLLEKLCHKAIDRTTDCNQKEPMPYLRQRDYKEFTSRVKCELPTSAKPFKKNVSKKSFHNSSNSNKYELPQENIISNNEERRNCKLQRADSLELRNEIGIKAEKDHTLNSSANIIKELNKIGKRKQKVVSFKTCAQQGIDEASKTSLKKNNELDLNLVSECKTNTNEILSNYNTNQGKTIITHVQQISKSEDFDGCKVPIIFTQNPNKEKDEIVSECCIQANNIEETVGHLTDKAKSNEQCASEIKPILINMCRVNSTTKTTFRNSETDDCKHTSSIKSDEVQDNSIWSRFVNFFKAKPGCSEPSDWKEQRMEDQALKPIIAIVNKPTNNIRSYKTINVNSAKREYSTKSKKNKIESKCGHESGANKTKGFKSTDKDCLETGVPTCNRAKSSSKCTMPMKQECKRTRTTCKPEKFLKDCCYVDAPFPAFTDIHPPFPPLRTNECTEMEKRRATKDSSSKRGYCTLITPNRYFSSSRDYFDSLPRTMLNSESNIDELDQQELATRMLDVLREYIEKSQGDASTKFPMIYNTKNINLFDDDQAKNEMEEKLIEAIKLFCRKAPLFYDKEQLELFEKEETKKIQSTLDELFKKYE